MVTAKNLIPAQFANSSPSTPYTSPADTTTIIDNFMACNTDSGGAHTITVYLVPNGQTALNSNQVISVLSIAASTTLNLTSMQNQILIPGDQIVVVASSASAIVIRASGRQVT